MSKKSDLALEKLTEVGSYLRHLATAFLDTGNGHMHGEMSKMSKDVHFQVQALKEEFRDIGNERFRAAEQNSANVLGAVLGGIEVRKRSQISEAAKHIAVYTADRKEQDDFKGRLCDDCILPKNGVDPGEWENKYEEFIKLIEKDEDVDEVVEWLAQNATGHVYAYARQILKEVE